MLLHNGKLRLVKVVCTFLDAAAEWAGAPAASSACRGAAAAIGAGAGAAASSSASSSSLSGSRAGALATAGAAAGTAIGVTAAATAAPLLPVAAAGRVGRVRPGQRPASPVAVLAGKNEGRSAWMADVMGARASWEGR